MTKLILKLKSFERELNDIKQNFTIVGLEYSATKDFAGITYTDGYITMTIIYEYIENINFWSIKEIF